MLRCPASRLPSPAPVPRPPPRRPRPALPTWPLAALAVVGSLLLAGTLSAQIVLTTVDGPGADQAFGSCLARLPDVNGDGVNDLLVGAFTKNASRGAAYVLSGKTGAILHGWDGTEDFEYLGQCVAGLGDLDNDGTADYAIGAPFLDINGFHDQGQVTLFSGKTGTALLALDGPVGQHSKFGTCIVNAGDVNGDGKADLAISSPEWVSPATALHSGRVEVRSGANLNATLFAVEGQFAGEKLGFHLAATGDVNHDGLADIIAGTDFTTPNGVACVFLGPSGAASWVFTGDATFDHFGCDVDGAGDVDKDGCADVVVGAFRAAFEIAKQPGYAKVFSGRTGLVLATLTGTQPDDLFGHGVLGAGDLNGDGWADVAIGSGGYDSVNGTTSGRVTTHEVLLHATNLGFGGPGTAQLSMYGSALDDFGQMDLALSGAKVSAPAWLLASAGSSFLAFKGGVLVPNIVTGTIIPLVTNASGKITIPGILGGFGGFGPVPIAMQYVIKDAAQPFGYAMSHAISAGFLP